MDGFMWGFYFVIMWKYISQLSVTVTKHLRNEFSKGTGLLAYSQSFQFMAGRLLLLACGEVAPHGEGIAEQSSFEKQKRKEPAPFKGLSLVTHFPSMRSYLLKALLPP